MDSPFGPETGGSRPDLRGRRVFHLQEFLIETEWEDWEFMILQFLKNTLDNTGITDEEFADRMHVANKVIIHLRRAAPPRYPETRVVVRLDSHSFELIYQHCLANDRPDFTVGAHLN